MTDLLSITLGSCGCEVAAAHGFALVGNSLGLGRCIFDEWV